MELDATILKTWRFWIAVMVILVVSGVPIALRHQHDPELRVVQLLDAHQMAVLSAQDAYVMDENGKTHLPDDSGILRVRPGLISVLETRTGKIIQVEKVPRDGPSPYPLAVRRNLRSARAQ